MSRRTDSRWPSAFGLLVFATDLALINGAFLATSLFKFGTWYPEGEFAALYMKFQVFVNLVFPLCLVLAGAYRDIVRAPLGHQAVTSFKACVWAAAITLGALFIDRTIGYSRAYVAGLLFEVAILIPFSRILLERVNAAVRMRGHGVRPVMLVGEREPLQELALRLRMAPQLGYRIAAVYPLGFEPLAGGGGANGALASPVVVRDREQLQALLARGGIRRIFLCDAGSDARAKTVIDLARERAVETRLVPWPVGVPDPRARIHDLLSVPLVPAEVPVRCQGWRAGFKRLSDVTAGTLLLALLSPFFALVALAIKLDSPGPVFYRQRRLTRGGRPFAILKFRSMHTLAEEERARLGDANEASGPLFKMRHDPRVTRVGAWLRRFSLDELPQILNVVKGDLSLVGPRPPLPEEVERYEPWQRHRLDVVQGLTGLWQVSGRSRLSFEEMALLDLHYIENWSLLLDLEILMETLPTVLHGDGAY